jgi:hypothetical protein
MIKMTANQLAGMPVRIGRLREQPVWRLKSKGGLILILTKNGEGKPQMLASGPQYGLVKFMAEQREPDIEFSELSKSDERHVIESGKHLIPLFNELTDKINNRLGI